MIAQLLAKNADLRRQLEETQVRLNDYRARFRDLEHELMIVHLGFVNSVSIPGKGDTSAYLELRERLAVIQHDIWSHWMTYQFSVCRRNDDGTMTIPAEKVLRWKRQAETLYGYLPDPERESDRHQADKILAALNTPPHRPGKGDTR